MPGPSFSFTDSDGARLPRGYIINTIVALMIFEAALALTSVYDQFDLPLTRALNALADKNILLDRIVLSLYSNELFSGILFVSLIWAIWFSVHDTEEKARVAVGTLTAWIAGLVSRTLQYVLSTHPRPFYDPRLNFHSPHFSDGVPLNTWNSFPSDHVTVFAGLVTVICLARLWSRWFVVAWAILIESTRTYMGAHYPTDLLGGAALGAAFVCASRTPALLRIGQKLVEQARVRPALFYGCAFILSYEIATLFYDLRAFVAEMLSLRHTL